MVARLNIPIPSSGLAIDRPAEFIDARSLSNVRDIQIDRQLVKKRVGSDALGASLGERILGMAELEVGLNTYFVRVGLTKVEVIDKSTLVWTSIANSALNGSDSDHVSFAFPVLSGDRIMVYTNGVDNIRKYTGSGDDDDLGGSPPKCLYMVDFAGYLVLANVDDNFAMVQWSDAGDPEEWSNGNAGSTNLLEDSLPITGISRFGNYLTVHKETAIYLGQLVDTDEVFRFTRKDVGAGTIANGSIQNLPDGTQIYLAIDGIRIFNGGSSTLIPSPIIEELRDSMNPKFLQRATSVLVKDLDEYWVGVPIGSQEEPETVYKYNYRTGQVYKDMRPGLMSLALYKLVDDESWNDTSYTWNNATRRWDSITQESIHRQVASGYEDGTSLLRSNSINDDDDPIDAIWDTKDFTVSDLEEGHSTGTMVRWMGLETWFFGDSVSIYYSTDSGSSWTLAETLTLDSDYPPDDSPDTVYFDVVSSKIRFRFRNNSADETWTLKQYTIQHSIREERK